MESCDSAAGFRAQCVSFLFHFLYLFISHYLAVFWGDINHSELGVVFPSLHCVIGSSSLEVLPWNADMFSLLDDDDDDPDVFFRFPDISSTQSSILPLRESISAVALAFVSARHSRYVASTFVCSSSDS